ncbi:PAS domain S-box-containing protein [Krasilnikovia cinnamomea]|uniref:histidine kinase n=1 Tax=Krasilnikovia cinnamomea TaxID=349313 RepID=A0A4Q7ZSY0_9ACTN|nr:PAS domain-containing hybrid sensor histidine kinase/response regulator [Krasilnikovia cinnamomea]RZU54307.1 PAS domain S-box-containing protein [Krasilnikovia cinnamomea]
MAILAITSLFMVVLLRVGWEYLRRRDPLLRDVMLVFAAVAMLFVLSALRLAGLTPPRTLTVLFSVALLGQPFFALRLVSRLRPVPAWGVGAALAVWLLSAVPVVVLPPPLPRMLVWLVVGAFFAVEAAAAVLLGAQARRRGGAARIRLWCAAAGTGLFGVALMIAGAGPAVAEVARAVALVSALMYLLAFVPPRWLRRLWSQNAAYAAMRRLLDAPVDEPAHYTWQRYCEQAREVLGADDVVVLVPVAPAGGAVHAVGRAGLALPKRDYGDAELDLLLARPVTLDALAGWTEPPRIAADLAAATGTRFVTAAPLPQSGRRGALVLLHRYRTLFAADDVALFAELAGHAAALADRAAVLAERERLAVIVESSHDAIIGKTLDGVITSWNRGAERLYGYSAGEVLGRHAAMLFPPGQEQTEAQLMDRIACGERIEQYQVQRRRRDGTVITVALTLSPITDPHGDVVGVASISRDISDRQRAEVMFRGLLESAPDAIIGVDRGGRIVLINAQAERLFGYARAELLGQSVDVLVPEAVRGTHVRHREGYFADPKARPMGHGMALTAVRKDGTEFPAEISLSALETDKGVIVSAAVRDVTERLAAQTERERLVTQAERDAAERRLQHTRRLESLGQLAGGVAHDFNNILAVIANYTELVLDTLDAAELQPVDVAAARTDLGQISRAAERATRLTKQLLAFGRREITQPEILNLNHVIGDVEQMLRRTLGEHIHLITDLDRRLWTVCADASQMEQILLNLAVNARDAMPAGGTLSLDTANIELAADDVADATLTPGRYVRVRVSDTGAGMPPEVAERAFEPFYTTKPAGAGTGLGLATVYGIATAADGDVHLYSEPGIGTTVTVLLPVTDDTADTPTTGAAAPAAEAPRRAAPQETILLVEDEPDLREATARILTRAGYHVLAAAGGEAALHIAETHPGPIHLLLTDVIMPKMMGNEVAARLHRRRPDTPVLYMSGYAQPVLTEHGRLPAGVTIIEKPFTRQHLLDRLHDVLHHTHPAPANPTT